MKNASAKAAASIIGRQLANRRSQVRPFLRVAVSPPVARLVPTRRLLLRRCGGPRRVPRHSPRDTWKPAPLVDPRHAPPLGRHSGPPQHQPSCPGPIPEPRLQSSHPCCLPHRRHYQRHLLSDRTTRGAELPLSNLAPESSSSKRSVTGAGKAGNSAAPGQGKDESMVLLHLHGNDHRRHVMESLTGHRLLCAQPCRPRTMMLDPRSQMEFPHHLPETDRKEGSR